MTKDEILRDLRQSYGPKVILSPEDLALAIGRSPKAQANMRSRGAFPMPIKRLGGKVGVSVYDLAAYLAGDAPIEVPSAAVRSASASPATPNRASSLSGNKAQAAAVKARPKKAAIPEPWLPARTRKSLGPALLGFREALNFWSAVHAELEASELSAAMSDTRRARARLRSA